MTAITCCPGTSKEFGGVAKRMAAAGHGAALRTPVSIKLQIFAARTDGADMAAGRDLFLSLGGAEVVWPGSGVRAMLPSGLALVGVDR